jgi:hypothetical protein
MCNLLFYYVAYQLYTEEFRSLSGNTDKNLESQYTCRHLFGVESDSKLLSVFPEGLTN